MKIVLSLLIVVLVGIVILQNKENQTGEPIGAVPPQPTDETEDVNVPVDVADDVVEKGVKNFKPILDLSGQGLSKAPEYIFSKTSIETLDLSNNKIDGALQAEVRHLQNLKSLDLSDNNFTGVPAEVGQLSKLVSLDLSNNPITGIPHELGNLKNLDILDLRGTNYSSFDLDVIKQGLKSSVKILVD